MAPGTSATRGCSAADGRYYTYDELLATADPALAGEVQSPVWRGKFDRAQAAVEFLAQRLAAAEPDVVVIVGDDQHELFGADGIPAIGLSPGNPCGTCRPTPSAWPRPPRTSARPAGPRTPTRPTAIPSPPSSASTWPAS